MKVINPANGHELADLPVDDAASVAAKHARAVAAQREWADRPLEDRIEIMRKFRATVRYRLEDLAAIMTSETGKPISQSRNELNGLLPRIDFFLDNVERTIDDEVVLLDDAAGMEEVISHEPLGVIANISAWNYPYFVGSNVFVPALLTGNAVLYKPSEFAALTGQAIAEMLWGAGVPEDVFALLIGAGEVGAALLEQRLGGVFFTGSYATGRRIAQAVAGSMTRVQLELGGKDPVYVCDDVDVIGAAEGLADGAFYNDGQSCCSVERIYVHDKVYDQFVDHFVKTVEGFVAGDPTEEGTYLGPLTRAAQLDVLDAQVADAVAKGATVRTGGRRDTAGDRAGGVWFEPTVLTDVTHDMAVMRDESFGPIIGIQRVADDREALALMNDTEFGLTAGVYAVDEMRATDILREVDAGTAYWNCCDRVSPRLPWSGRGHSGLGSTLSTYGILTFLQPKAWHLRQPG
jgi:acyl-CoA reductase-like NAD-dependent aldehyde dehydrogenase